MQPSNIWYVCFYDTPDSRENRSYSPAAAQKIRYIAQTLASGGSTVRLISGSQTRGNAYQRGGEELLEESVYLRKFSSWGMKNRLLRQLPKLLFRIKLFLYLLFQIGKNDIVIVYHSLFYMRMIGTLKRLKRFRLIYEVEEIYADVEGNPSLRKKELENLRVGDAYLFPTTALRDIVDVNGKPSVIVHGVYLAQPETVRPEDGIVHCIYAGTLDPRKGGAELAVRAAAMLPEGYHIHILGFGSEEKVRNIRLLIGAVQQKTCAAVSYDGVLLGEDYTRFLGACHIGLSTQQPDAAFNGSSFPSKILSYLACGLQVVTIRIPVVEHSDIGDVLYYYDEPSPEALAEAIRRVDFQSSSLGRTALQTLDERFKKELAALVERMGMS